MRWATNVTRRTADKFLSSAQNGRPRVIGEPKASERFTAAALSAMGLVGIYELEPEDAPHE